MVHTCANVLIFLVAATALPDDGLKVPCTAFLAYASSAWSNENANDLANSWQPAQNQGPEIGPEKPGACRLRFVTINKPTALCGSHGELPTWKRGDFRRTYAKCPGKLEYVFREDFLRCSDPTRRLQPKDVPELMLQVEFIVPPSLPTSSCAPVLCTMPGTGICGTQCTFLPLLFDEENTDDVFRRVQEFFEKEQGAADPQVRSDDFLCSVKVNRLRDAALRGSQRALVNFTVSGMQANPLYEPGERLSSFAVIEVDGSASCGLIACGGSISISLR